MIRTNTRWDLVERERVLPGVGRPKRAGECAGTRDEANPTPALESSREAVG
jgi:hypothetical protein